MCKEVGGTRARSDWEENEIEEATTSCKKKKVPSAKEINVDTDVVAGDTECFLGGQDASALISSGCGKSQELQVLSMKICRVILQVGIRQISLAEHPMRARLTLSPECRYSRHFGSAVTEWLHTPFFHSDPIPLSEEYYLLPVFDSWAELSRNVK